MDDVRIHAAAAMGSTETLDELWWSEVDALFDRFDVWDDHEDPPNEYRDGGWSVTFADLIR